MRPPAEAAPAAKTGKGKKKGLVAKDKKAPRARPRAPRRPESTEPETT